MAQSLFLVIFFCEAVLASILCLSILAPEKRVWPPPNGNSWQMYVVWTPIIVAFLATVWLGALDRNTFVLGHWSRFVAGGLLMSGGYAIYYRGRQSLGWKTMMGIRGTFVATGVYRYTRNPIYVGDIALSMGFALLCNSLLSIRCCRHRIGLVLLDTFRRRTMASRSIRNSVRRIYGKGSAIRPIIPSLHET